MHIDVKNIERKVLDFIRKEEGKLPIELEHAAAFGEKYIARARAALQSGTALEFTTLVPEAEPFRTAIIGILTGVETAFKAVDKAYHGGMLLTATSQIAALQVPGVSMDHVVLAVQSGYVKSLPTATAAHPTNGMG